ncbi:MAG: STAS domain-containing protein, partial [Candidatus Sumerlaeota bacterium]
MIQILDAQKAAIVRLEGDLDIGTVEDLRPRLLEHLGNGIHHFVFDMKRARFMCSMGLGFLVDLYHGVEPYQGSVRLENVAPAIQKLLEATHLSRIFMDGEALNILNKPDETREAVSRQMGEEVHLQSILAEATGQILVAQRPEEIQDRALAAVLRGLHSEKGLLLSVEHRADGIHMLSLAASRGFAPEDLEELRMVRLRFDSPDARFLREPQPRLLDPETRSQLMRASGLTQAIFAP